MIDLNPYIPPEKQKKVGPVLMSDKAAEELRAVLGEHGHTELDFRPFVAATVTGFLDSVYFAKSAWFQKQPVHRTMTILIGDQAGPIMHLRKTKQGHTVVACDEAPLPEAYYEERLIEEVKVEITV